MQERDQDGRLKEDFLRRKEWEQSPTGTVVYKAYRPASQSGSLKEGRFLRSGGGSYDSCAERYLLTVRSDEEYPQYKNDGYKYRCEYRRMTHDVTVPEAVWYRTRVGDRWTGDPAGAPPPPLCAGSTLMAHREDGAVSVWHQAADEGDSIDLGVWRRDDGRMTLSFGGAVLWPRDGSLGDQATTSDAMDAWAEAEGLRLVTIDGAQVWPQPGLGEAGRG